MTMAFQSKAGAIKSLKKRAPAPVISSEMLTGMMFAGALAAMAICAILASPQPDADAISWIGMTGP